MRSARIRRLVLLVGMLCSWWLPAWAADAPEGPPDKVPVAQPAPQSDYSSQYLRMVSLKRAQRAARRGRRVGDGTGATRAGRITSYASWGVFGYAAVSFGLGMGLQVYDYNGPWFDKYKYDRAFNKRFDVGVGLNVSSAIAAGISVPTLFVGVLLEGRALKRMGYVGTAFGWTGLGLFAGGGAFLPLAVASFSGFLIATAITVTSVGWIFGIVQFGLNLRAAKRIGPEERQRLYAKRKKVSVAVAPMPVREGGGAALVGRF